jgi:hypothetical protein
VLYGGKVKNSQNLNSLLCLAILLAGVALSGCKSTPDLTESNAQTLIQAKYDAQPPVGVNIRVDDPAMLQGIDAKYWTRTKVYPNKFWADFTLTADGKKVIKLPGGGDVIQWRPDNAGDTGYSIMVVTVAANHLKAHDVTNIHDETVPGVDGTAKVANYNESVSLDGVPETLVRIAHRPGNQLATKHTADFALDNGAWKLFSTN